MVTVIEIQNLPQVIRGILCFSYWFWRKIRKASEQWRKLNNVLVFTNSMWCSDTGLSGANWLQTCGKFIVKLMWELTWCNRNSNLIIWMKDHAAHEYKGILNHCSFLAQMEHVKLCHKQFVLYCSCCTDKSYKLLKL